MSTVLEPLTQSDMNGGMTDPSRTEILLVDDETALREP